MMRKSKIDHLLRAAASVTGHSTFVLVGSTVVLVRCRNIPAGTLLLELDDTADQQPHCEGIERRPATAV